jgi:YegS/Rv2252/BmrU family lipid kinase
MEKYTSEPVKSAARACVIFNPAAKGDKARRFRRCLEAIGAECVLKATTAPGDARRLAAEAISEGFDSIIAAGGDGTLNEVVNGFGDASDGFERACLGVLPLGTVNVFARELGIPTRPEPAWEVIQQRREVRIDLPCVEYSGHGGRERRYFVQLAGAGLDARAIELVNWPLKKIIGPLAYVVAGLKALLEKPASITVSAGAPAVTGQLVLIGNGRLYGGHFNIFPRGDLRDGLLEVCVFPRVNWFTLARCGLPLLFHGKLPDAVSRQFQAATVTLASQFPTPLEADGELIGHLPATFSVQRAKLRVLVPRDYETGGRSENQINPPPAAPRH